MDRNKKYELLLKEVHKKIELENNVNIDKETKQKLYFHAIESMASAYIKIEEKSIGTLPQLILSNDNVIISFEYSCQPHFKCRNEHSIDLILARKEDGKIIIKDKKLVQWRENLEKRVDRLIERYNKQGELLKKKKALEF